MAQCYINGMHADAHGAAGWNFICGPHPYVHEYEMDAAEAASLLKGGKAALTIMDSGGTLKVEYLDVIGEGPASNPYLRTVVLADLRWRWSRAWVYGRYNIRRRTGRKTLLGQAVIELAQTADVYQFAKYSLKNSEKWKPREVLEDVFGKLMAVGAFHYEIPKELQDALEVNDLDIDDPGPEAIGIALRHLPGYDLFVNREGSVVVQSKVDLSEAGVLESGAGSGAEIVGGGHVSKVSYKYTRPSKIIVYFTREQEVRFDSTVEGSEFVQGDESRSMENVLQVTDPTILVGEEYTNLGSWVPFQMAFPYWNTTKEIASAFDIGYDVIEAAFFEDNLYNVYVPWGGEDAQPIWIGRIASVKAHFRQTYQINRQWMDRAHKATPFRAGVLDVTNMKRARAQAFTDYCVKLSTRHIGKDPARQYLYKNVTGYAASLADAWVSPAIIQMLDDEVGIFHLDYQVDPFGVGKMIFPSKMDNIPSANMGDLNTRALGVRYGRFGSFPKLSSNHRVAVVLTLVPAAPNSIGQFMAVEVKPEDVKDKIHGIAIEPANGPAWHIHIGHGTITARTAWKDDSAATIERSFGIGIQEPNSPEARAALDEQIAKDVKILQELTINYDDLEAAAKAIAAQVWAKLADRYIGSRTIRLNPGVEPKGAIRTVSHRVEPDGRVVTEISLPEELQERNWMAMLPEATRRFIFREVQA